MALVTSYKRLFNTRITHTFYEGGISKKDLAVFPTEATATAMKNANMLFRKDEDGFRVLYRDNGSGAAFIPFSNVNLVFGLQLLNINEFMNFTQLTNYTPGKILYFTNKPATTANNLVPSLIDYLRPTSFTYQFPQTASAPGSLTDLGSIVIKDAANNIVTPAPPPPSIGIVSDQNKKYHYPINFSKMPKGLYKFETANVSEGAATEYIYIDNDLARKGVFGLVDILAVNELAINYPIVPVIQPSLPVPPINEIRVYDMNFVRRTTFWKYIVVLKSGSVNLPALGLAITDTNQGQSPYGALTFTRKNDIKINGIDAVEFTSFSTAPNVPPDTSPIPFFESVKTGLNIVDTPGTVASNIANPSFGLVSGAGTTVSPTEIFVTI